MEAKPEVILLMPFIGHWCVSEEDHSTMELIILKQCTLIYYFYFIHVVCVMGGWTGMSSVGFGSVQGGL